MQTQEEQDALAAKCHSLALCISQIPRILITPKQNRAIATQNGVQEWFSWLDDKEEEECSEQED